MTEGRRSRILDTTIRRFFGRDGIVSSILAVAPGIRELMFRAEPPTGGWQPGHEIELWVGDSIVRHYTVSRVEAADQFGIVADLYSGGPGARWLNQAGPGTAAQIARASTRTGNWRPDALCCSATPAQ